MTKAEPKGEAWLAPAVLWYERASQWERSDLGPDVRPEPGVHDRFRAWRAFLWTRCGAAIALLVLLVALTWGVAALWVLFAAPGTHTVDPQPWFWVLAGYALLLAFLPPASWRILSWLVALTVSTAALTGSSGTPGAAEFQAGFSVVPVLGEQVGSLSTAGETAVVPLLVLVCLAAVPLALRAARRIAMVTPAPLLATLRRGGPSVGWGWRGSARRLLALPLLCVLLAAVAWLVLAVPVLMSQGETAAREALDRAVISAALLLPLVGSGAVLTGTRSYRFSVLRLVLVMAAVVYAALWPAHPDSWWTPGPDLLALVHHTLAEYLAVVEEPVSRMVEFVLLPTGGTLPDQVLNGLVLVVLPASLLVFYAVRSLLRF